MNLKSRLTRLEDAAPPGAQIIMVNLNCPPDGRTLVFLSDGTEAPEGTDWQGLDPPPQCVIGVDPDLVMGRRRSAGAIKVYDGVDVDRV